MQTQHPDSKNCWVAGYSFGAWIGMQLLMRRPEIESFISVAPQPNIYDFSFLAPCPSSGLIIHGDIDKVAPPKDVQTLVDKLKTQKGITITQEILEGANHFLAGAIRNLLKNAHNIWIIILQVSSLLLHLKYFHLLRNVGNKKHSDNRYAVYLLHFSKLSSYFICL